MNYNRIYEYRFEGIDSNSKKVAWEEISSFLFEKMKNPKVVLDPAAVFANLLILFHLQKNGPLIKI